MTNRILFVAGAAVLVAVAALFAAQYAASLMVTVPNQVSSTLPQFVIGLVGGAAALAATITAAVGISRWRERGGLPVGIILVVVGILLGLLNLLTVAFSVLTVR